MSNLKQSLLPPSEEIDHPSLGVVERERLPLPAYPVRESDWSYYLKAIYERKWLIVSVVIILTTIITLRDARQPALYEATTTIRIEPPTSDPLQGTGVGGGGYYYRGFEYWNTELKELQSPQLMRQVALSLNLQHNPSFFGPPRSEGLVATVRRVLSRRAAAKTPQGGEPAPSPAAQQPAAIPLVEDANRPAAEQAPELTPYVAGLLGGLSVSPVKETNLINISFKHPDPTVATQVANTVARVFIENEYRRETAGMQNASVKLAQEIASLQVSIKQQEEQRINEMKSRDLPLGDAKGQNLTTARLGTLSDQLLAAEGERKSLQAAYEQAAKATDPWTIPEVSQNPELLESRKELRRVEQLLAAKRQKYTDEWPEVRELAAQVEEVKAKLERGARDTVAVMEARYRAATEREHKLRESYEAERAGANLQSQSEIMLGSLNQQISTSKELYSTLFQKQKEQEIVANRHASNITVSTPASIPSAPLPQNRARGVFIAAGISTLFGLMLALGLSFLDNTLKSVEDVEHHTQLPALAVIPIAGGKRRRLARGGQEEGVTALALTRDLRSPSAEAYRHLRASLLLTTVGGAPKTILITSGMTGEGKTTTAINTAVTFAQEVSGAQQSPPVLLIDCDLRRPRIHTHFGLSNTKGLTTHLAGAADIGSLLHTYEALPNLKILTAGPMPANPSDFLGSREMLNLLQAAGERFKYIILDSPPATSFADAAQLATLVDGVVIVASCRRSTRAIVQRVKQRLSDVGAHVFGVVLNFADDRADSYYSEYYSSYYDDEQQVPREAAAAAPVGRLTGDS